VKAKQKAPTQKQVKKIRTKQGQAGIDLAKQDQAQQGKP